MEAIQVLELSQVELFASAIDLGVFATGPNQTTRFRRAALTGRAFLQDLWKFEFSKLITSLAPDKTCVLLPSNSAASPENSVKLWDNLLNYVTNKPSTFPFWFDNLKKQYFSIFYPDICKKIGIIDDGIYLYITTLQLFTVLGRKLKLICIFLIKWRFWISSLLPSSYSKSQY